MASKVAIIGGAGRMGEWFARYFSTREMRVIVSDVRTREAGEIASAAGVELVERNIDAAEDADVALVCVPIERVPSVVLEIAPSMRTGSVLAEVSSVKKRAVEALREASAFGIQPLSVHPMFGPAVESLEGKTVVVVPVADADAETWIARRLFKEAEIVVSSQADHDRAMALVLSLTYFLNLVFARVLCGEDLLSLKRLSGTTFSVQLALAESIVSEDPGLVESLLNENSFTEGCLDSFIDECRRVKGLIGGGPEDFLDLYDSLRASLQHDPDYRFAGARRYRAFEALRKK